MKKDWKHPKNRGRRGGRCWNNAFCLFFFVPFERRAKLALKKQAMKGVHPLPPLSQSCLLSAFLCARSMPVSSFLRAVFDETGLNDGHCQSPKIAAAGAIDRRLAYLLARRSFHSHLAVIVFVHFNSLVVPVLLTEPTTRKSIVLGRTGKNKIHTFAYSHSFILLLNVRVFIFVVYKWAFSKNMGLKFCGSLKQGRKEWGGGKREGHIERERVSVSITKCCYSQLKLEGTTRTQPLCGVSCCCLGWFFNENEAITRDENVLYVKKFRVSECTFCTQFFVDDSND